MGPMGSDWAPMGSDWVISHTPLWRYTNAVIIIKTSLHVTNG